MWVSRSEVQTEQFGRELAKVLREGDVVSLNGPLGTGKTRLVAGLVAGCGGETTPVTSPTFSLIHEYPTHPAIAHCDAYRLADTDEFLELGVSELWENGIVVVEWGDRVADALPPTSIRIVGTPTGPQERRFTVSANDDRTWPRRD